MTFSPRVALACAFGGLLGLSPFLGGLYDLSRWGWVAIAAALVAIVVMAATSAFPRGWAALAPAALLTLAVIQFASSAWAEDTEQSVLSGHRTLLYAVSLALLLILFRDRRAAPAFFAGVVAGVAVVAARDLVLLLGGGDPDLFHRGRLDAPLGYVNGQADVFALACWPLLAAAERAKHRIAAGGAAALATLLLAMLVLTQSRGALVAVISGAFAVVVMFPGRTKRLAVLSLVVMALAAAWSNLSAVAAGFDVAAGVSDATARRAAVSVIVAALGSGLLWGSLLQLERRIPWRVAWTQRRSVIRGTWLVCGTVAIVAAAVAGPSLASSIDDRIEGFKSLKPPETDSRLTSAGGNRYDYWRVALSQFRQWPLGGVGAGNFDRTYFAERRTEEDVRQPHSIEFQALAETGVGGALALLVFFGAGLAAVVSRARQARSTGTGIGLPLAATGIWVTWAVHTSVDWIHLLPGTTLPALAALAVLTGRWDLQSLRKPWLPVRPTLFAGITVAVASLGVLVVADHYRAEAVDALPGQPEKAANSARSALKLVADAPDTYYVLAAAQARMGRYEKARATLLEGSRRKPHDFVPHALLGDLALRRGDFSTARSDYERALRLNPRSSALQAALKVARDRELRK